MNNACSRGFLGFSRLLLIRGFLIIINKRFFRIFKVIVNNLENPKKPLLHALFILCCPLNLAKSCIYLCISRPFTTKKNSPKKRPRLIYESYTKT